MRRNDEATSIQMQRNWLSMASWLPPPLCEDREANKEKFLHDGRYTSNFPSTHSRGEDKSARGFFLSNMN